jgi:hypothetical protein
MNGNRRGAVSGSVARWAGVASMVAVCAACTTKVTTAIVTGPKVERRVPIEAGAIGSSTWRWDGKGFTGNIAWRTCRIETSWKETEQRTTSSRTTAAVPFLVAGAGLALAVAGFATYDYDGVERKCTNDAVGLCYDVEADNTGASLLMLGGGALMGVGAGMGVIKTKPQVTDGKPEQKRSSRDAPCVQPEDLAELVLVLQITERKFLTIQVERDGSARIPIPTGIALQRNVDLPVLVYRVPRKASQVVPRWSVVGHARADAEGARDHK